MLLLHGEPSWSYLYRKMIPVLVDAGFRCVAPDLIGFGRSDKPAQLEDYTYARHVEWLRSVLFDALDLQDVTLVCQDWGGLLGLRLVAEHPDALRPRVRRQHRAAGRAAAAAGRLVAVPRLRRAHRGPAVGFLVASGCAEPLPPEVQAAYDAPFPDASYKAGPRAFPDLIPQDPDDPATPDNQAAWEVLAQFDKPFLCAFSRRGPDHRRRRADAHRQDPRRGRPAAHDDRGRRPLPAGGPRSRAGQGGRGLGPRVVRLELQIALSLLRRGSRHVLGDDRSQVADLHLPSGPGPFPVVVLLHGGYWQTKYGKLVTRRWRWTWSRAGGPRGTSSTAGSATAGAGAAAGRRPSTTSLRGSTRWPGSTRRWTSRRSCSSATPPAASSRCGRPVVAVCRTGRWVRRRGSSRRRSWRWRR